MPFSHKLNRIRIIIYRNSYESETTPQSPMRAKSVLSYLKKILLFICIFFLTIHFVKNNRFEIISIISSNNLKTIQTTEKVCTPLQITPHLISLFYHYDQLKSIQNVPTCLIAADMRQKNKKKNLMPDVAFSSYDAQQCQSISSESIYLIFPEYNQFAYKTPDKKQICTTKEKCAEIIRETEDFIILMWGQELEFFRPQKPFVWEKITQNIYPTRVEKDFKWDEFKKNVELHLVPGGLGNHLFQYWTGKIYALKKGRKLYMTQSYPAKLSDAFIVTEQNVPDDAVIYSKQSPLIQAFYKNKTIGSAQKMDNYPDYVFMKGYLQSYYNFADHEEYVRKNTKFKYPLSLKNQKIAKKMQLENSVMIHIRRGDYSLLNYHLLSSDYYKRAVEYINKRVKNPHYYIFSNDMNWAKKNLTIKEKHTFVDWNQKDHEDMQLMTYCKHHIIANSTFSWWGAFLSPYKNKIVITPKEWIPWATYWQNELILPNWIRQEN